MGVSRHSAVGNARMRSPESYFVLVLVAAAAFTANQPVTIAESAQQTASPFLDEAVAQIDELIDHALAERKLEPQLITSDVQFVRRVYLDAIGRIPTLAESQEFLASNQPDKRRTLIDRLLDSPGYVSHQYNLWADVLRIKDEDAAISRTFYINWLKDSLAANKSYDQMVRELVTASGSAWEPGNGAVGYYFRDRGMPLDNMSNTVRIFLGTRIGCAQCHDHPHDRWTRRQMYEMAAFTDKLTTDNTDELFSAIYDREKTATDEDLRAFSQYIRNTYHRDRVVGKPDGTICLPDDYQYDNAAPGASIDARPLFGELPPTSKVANEEHADYRHRFGNWLTSPDNPRFTQVIASRLWKRVMGRGLIEPVDDLHDDTQATHPELLAYLTQIMRDMNYDMKAYVRILYNTATYQRCTNPQEPGGPADDLYQGHLLTRMTSEQLWDSLVTLTVSDVDTKSSGFYDAAVYYGGVRVLDGKEDMYSRYEQTMHHNVDTHWKFLAEQLQAMKSDLQSKAPESKLASDDVGRGFYRRPNSRGVLVRASELRSPEVPSHFLRILGQSNREFIEGGSKAANVPQFLSMFNGYVEESLLASDESELMRQVAVAGSPAEKCNVIFTSVLGRSPTSDERQMVDELIESSRDGWCRDLIWSLLNTQEFSFIE